MAGYIYLPVPTAEMIGFANDWIEGQQRKGKHPYTVVQNTDHGWFKTRGVLRGLTAADKLYILAHGADVGSRWVGAAKHPGGPTKKYSPHALAVLLHAEGLTRQFVDLRVFACGSALTPPTATRSFALGLAQELRALRYAAVQVTGYQGQTRTSYSLRLERPGLIGDNEHKGVEINGEIFPASTRRVVF